MGIKHRRGIFYSADAIVAFSLIILFILIIVPVSKRPTIHTDLHRDIIASLSELKISELNDTYLYSLVSQGVLLDGNKSVLEQLGDFYVSNISLAQGLAYSILNEINTTQNIGIWYEDKLIASKNSTSIESSKNIDVARQTISGIREGGSVTGYSVRSFLVNSALTKYFYFGGYIGDGNISARVEYDGTISSAEIELAINDDFDLYINSIYSGTFSKSPSETTPIVHEINITNFHSGVNTLELRGENLHIAGGFIKVEYQTETPFSSTQRYYFPGVEGLINIYDGFFVPGNLTSMNMFLHMNSNYSSFLHIGNVTIYNGTTSGEQTISISNSQLDSLLNYNELSRKTTPIRLGLKNVSYTTTGITNKVDAVSTTDLSGSMLACAVYSTVPTLTCHYYCSSFLGSYWTQCPIADGNASSCTGNYCNRFICGPSQHYTDYQNTSSCNMTKLQMAQLANNVFIDGVLNISENRIGLIGYKTSVSASDTHALSNNSASLKSEVSGWTSSGNTCVCCGINEAVKLLNSTVNSTRVIVVMSDGEANVQCPQQGTGDAKQDAVNAACTAKNQYNITVHAVAFGSDADETTMQQIANCGDGDYYFGNVDELAELYSQIAQSIINAQYVEQTIESQGGFFTKLYPDSYVEFSYLADEIPYGLILTNEKIFDNSSAVTFSLPSNSSLVDFAVTSYSGSKWTDEVSINGDKVYDLSEYGSEYISYGDPYRIFIDPARVSDPSVISLTVANTPSNSTSGSASNKIIYTIAKEASSYSAISAKAEGCIWHVEFEDGTDLLIPVPSSYTGIDSCSYTEASQQFDETDGMQNAVFDLLGLLDFDSDGKVDLKFSEQELGIESSEVTGIPYTWATEVQVRTWR